MADETIFTAGSLIPEDFKAMDSDNESDIDSLHIESAQDIMLPFSTHLPDFLPNGDDSEMVTIEQDDSCATVQVDLSTVDLSELQAAYSTTQMASSLPPVTPTKPQDSLIVLDPLTPTANLKVLMSAASPEIRNMEKRQKSKMLFNTILQVASQQNMELQQSSGVEFEVDVEGGIPLGEEYVDDTEKPANRKAKSLGLLCQRFLSKYPDYPPNNQPMEISLDAVSKELCVERRRIYDIVNVLESVEMVQRRAKNKYLWHGKMYLEATLVKLKFLGERNGYASQTEHLKKLQVERDKDKEFHPLKDFTNTAGQDAAGTGGKRFLEEDPNARKDKSLGVMSQKFIMLFLVSKNQLVTLDIAARVLIADINYEIIENSKFKTKVRRLYDIANILTSLCMIKKVHIHERRGRKPAFRWIGPNPDISGIDLSQFDLDCKPVIRHSHFPPPLATGSASSSTTYPPHIKPKARNNKRPSVFPRHASFNIMRNVTESQKRSCSSAPSSPVKMEDQMAVSQDKSEKFKREFDSLRTKYPDCMSKLFAACNVEQEILQKEQEAAKQQQMMSSSGRTDESNQEDEVSDQLQSARKVLNMDGQSESSDCALQDSGTARRSKRTIKQPVKEEYEYQPVVKRTKLELHATTTDLQKCNSIPSAMAGEKTHITVKRVKTENLMERVMSELTTKKTNGQQSPDDVLPPDLAFLQESVGMTSSKPSCSAVTTTMSQKGSAFVPVMKHHEQIQESHTKVTPKQLSTKSRSPKNLPLIRNPTTKTIHMPKDLINILLCKERLELGNETPKASHQFSIKKADGGQIFVSTKPVSPVKMKSPCESSSSSSSTTASPASSPTDSALGESSMSLSSSPTESRLSHSSGHCESPHPDRCGSVGAMAELERIPGSKSMPQSHSKSVSPSASQVQGGGKPFPTVMVRQPLSTIGSSNIPVPWLHSTFVRTPIPRSAATVPIRYATVTLPSTPVTSHPSVTLVANSSVPTITHSPAAGQFMPITSILPPHTCTSVVTAPPLQTALPAYTATSAACLTTASYVSPHTRIPAGLITPTTVGENINVNDINFYRTPTTLPLGSVPVKATTLGGLGIGSPYVLTGIGGAIGQLQPVSRRLTLTMPPFSQS